MTQRYQQQIKLIVIVGVLFFCGLGCIFLYETFITEQRTNPSKILPFDYISKPSVISKEATIDQVVLPHHLIVRNVTYRFLVEYAQTHRTPDRIIIVGPDHFDRTRTFVAVQAMNQQAKEVALEMRREAKDYFNQEAVFANEHSIGNINPLVREVYGDDIPIIGVLIRDNADNATLTQFADTIISHTKGRTLIIYSIDFSHNLDRAFAQIHTALIARRLRAGRIDDIAWWDIDCRACVRLAYQIGSESDAVFLDVAQITDAGTLSQLDLPGENTSHIFGTWTSHVPSPTLPVADIFFGGDVMLDRHMRTLASQNGTEHFIDDVERLFWNWDAVVWNLEGVVTRHASVSQNKPSRDPAHYQFTFSPETVQKIVEQMRSPVIVNDGNNHSLDFGRVGIQSSRDHLAHMDVRSFGDVQGMPTQMLRAEIGGRPVSFVGYNAFLGNDYNKALQLVRKEAEAGRDVIVYAHWGREYERTPTDVTHTLAHAFIDAGARLVIGSHPHVAQPVEVYHGALIFYSLGNLLFDQFFSPDVQQRMVVGCRLQNKETYCTIAPLIHHYKQGLVFQKGAERTAFFAWLSQTSDVSDEQRVQLRHGEIKAMR